MKLDTMTGTGRAIVSTPAIAQSEPTIFPHTPTGLGEGGDKCDVGISERPHKRHSLPVPGLPDHL